MNRIIFLALLAGGVALIILGVQDTNFYRADFFRLLSGSQTDKAIGIFVCGIVASVVGLLGTMRGSRES